MRPPAGRGGPGGFPRGSVTAAPPPGVRLAQQQEVGISYTAGTLSFLDTPAVYSQGSPVRGKVRPLRPRVTGAGPRLT